MYQWTWGNTSCVWKKRKHSSLFKAQIKIKETINKASWQITEGKKSRVLVPQEGSWINWKRFIRFKIWCGRTSWSCVGKYHSKWSIPGKHHVKICKFKRVAAILSNFNFNDMSYSDLENSNFLGSKDLNCWTSYRKLYIKFTSWSTKLQPPVLGTKIIWPAYFIFCNLPKF